MDSAEHIYLKATQDHPDSAAAYNNLAQTLSGQGKTISKILCETVIIWRKFDANITHKNR